MLSKMTRLTTMGRRCKYPHIFPPRQTDTHRGQYLHFTHPNYVSRTYSLNARSVIMIVDDQDAVPEFPAGHTVLALYPSTTCFYKAIVVRPPSKVQYVILSFLHM